MVDQDDQGIPRMASSTPKPYKMAPNVPGIDHPLMFYNSPPNNSISFSHPKIPVFTGEEKSEISFEVWKFEVKCILKEKNYSMHFFSFKLLKVPAIFLVLKMTLYTSSIKTIIIPFTKRFSEKTSISD